MKLQKKADAHPLDFRLRQPTLGNNPMLAIVLDRVDSTNEEAKRKISQGAIAASAFVMAREQTAGKGNHGRHWLSPRDAGLYLTVVDRSPRPTPFNTALYTQAAGVACVQTLHEIACVDVHLKPINDLYVAGKKLGGILTEALVEGGRTKAILVGIGINLARVDRTLPAGSVTPTCLQELISPRRFQKFDRLQFGRLLAKETLRWIRIADTGDKTAIERAWARHVLG